jgi:tRNA (5-methylaminomethyl-2-thiouridylate)-methyltransferase
MGSPEITAIYGLRDHRYFHRVRYAMLLSGGVDSSTALAELVAAGHSVHAYYLKVWLEDELDYLGSCPWEEDLSYARAVCEQFKVQLTVVPLQLQYHEAVVTYTLEELKAGRTPSPDIFCNERIKFGAFLDYLEEKEGRSADVRIASGHYAQIVRRDDNVALMRSPDPVKDQTYFLCHLHAEQLSRLEFPIGHHTKEEVRAKAEHYELANKERKDSQGICFLGKIRYPEFVRHYLGEQAGQTLEWETGRVLGLHKGYWFYTIGQRQGLGLGGGPWYVVNKDVEANIVYVSHSMSAAERARHTFTVSELSWNGSPAADGDSLVKIRHGPKLHQARLRRIDPDRIEVTLREADRGVAPGQFAVFYEGQRCLGCGKIEEEQCTYS